VPPSPSDGHVGERAAVDAREDERTASSLVERIWHGTEPASRLARLVLAPAAGLYRGIVAARGALYDIGLLPARPTALPALSVGNLSVGGTGKTPVSAYIAARLRDRGGSPAIVLRGYGGDEPLVHATLNPDIPVVVSADRVAGVAKARVLGADVAVLDDAFQHRRAERWGDIVLVSADSWSAKQRLLPAGPWREPVRGLRRAALAIVTRKAASLDEARAVVAALQAVVPKLKTAIVWLAPGDLYDARGTQSRPLSDIAGKRLHVIAAIGDPRRSSVSWRWRGRQASLRASFPTTTISARRTRPGLRSRPGAPKLSSARSRTR